jgi:hypothetical protein
MNEEDRQLAKNPAAVQQSTPVLLYLFSVAFLVVVLVS